MFARLYKIIFPDTANTANTAKVMIVDFHSSIEKKDYEQARTLLAKLLEFAKNYPQEKKYIMGRLNDTLSLIIRLSKNHENQLDLFKVLLEIPEIGLNEKQYRSLLSESIHYKQIEILKLLIERKDINPDIRNLLWAIEKEDKEIVELLLQNEHLDLNEPDEYGYLPLITAIEKSYRSKEMQKILEMLLKRDINVNVTNKEGMAVLILALKLYKNVKKDLQNLHFKNIQLLLEKKDIEVNTRDHDGRTPLMIAAKADMRDVINLLLQKENIDINAVDKDQNTALMLSIHGDDIYQYTTSLPLLKMPNIEVNATDTQGRTALYLAVVQSQREVVSTLLEFPEINVNLLPNRVTSRESFLIGSLRQGFPEFVTALYRSHPNMLKDLISKDNENGFYPLIWALQNKLYSNNGCGAEAVKALLDLSKDNIDIADREGNTPLIWAAMNGEHASFFTFKVKDIVQILLKAGANPKRCNKKGETALMLAKDEAIIKLMMDQIQLKEEKEIIEIETPFTNENNEIASMAKKNIMAVNCVAANEKPTLTRRLSQTFFEGAEKNPKDKEENKTQTLGAYRL